MSFRFFRRKKLFPGVSLNLSKSGASLSFGPRGAKVTVGPKGVRKTLGIPGTGAYWTKHIGFGPAKRPSRSQPKAPALPPPPLPAPQPRPQDRLSLGFFERLLIPKSEGHFVDGMKWLIQADNAAALSHFEKAQSWPMPRSWRGFSR